MRVQHGSNRRFVARELRTREANEDLVPVPEVVSKLFWSLGNSWYRVQVDRARKCERWWGNFLELSYCPTPSVQDC